jgi:hypothetical protein
LNSCFHAVDGGQHTDDTKNAKRNSKQRQKCAQLIGTEFLDCHFQARINDIEVTGQVFGFDAQYRNKSAYFFAVHPDSAMN